MYNVTIVVACFDESDVLRQTAKVLNNVIDELVSSGLAKKESSVYFVDDGSKDETWQIIEHLAVESRFHGIKLSRNCGHQNALLAGLLTAPGDVLISLDADLQDDVGVIDQMILEHQAGAEVVYGVRASRQVDSWFKRETANIYYSLLTFLGADIVPGHADFRLMSRQAIDALSRYEETNLYIRGIVPQLGFKTAQVYYRRKARIAGREKYTLGKQIALAINGVTSLSGVPLRAIALIGVTMSVLSMFAGFWAVTIRLFTNNSLPGWASTVIPMFLLAGIQLFSLGIIGEYIGRIFDETKRRPRYIIEKLI